MRDRAPAKLPKLVIASRRNIFLAAGLIWFVTIAGVWWFHAWQLRAITTVQKEEARIDASNLTKLNSSHAASVLERLDRLLRFLAEMTQEDRYVLKVVGAIASRIHLQQGVAAHVSIVSHDGAVLYSSADALIGMDLSDKPFFRAHQSHDTGELLISDPVQEPVSGKWLIPLSRRINRKDGSFDGIALSAIPVAYFIQQYESVELLPQSIQLLAKVDGVILARLRGKSVVLGNMRSGQRILEDIRKGNTSGDAVARSEVDGIERAYHYRVVPGFPLIVMAGLSVDEVVALADESRNALVVESSLLTLVLSILVGAILSVVLRQRRQIEEGSRLTRFLLDGEERWNLALQGAGTTLWDWNARDDQIYVLSSGENPLDPLREMSFSMSEWLAMVHPQDRQKARDKFVAHLQQKGPLYEMELRHLGGGAEYRQYVVHGVSQFDTGHRVTRMTGYARDCTVERLAEAAAKVRTAQLDAVFELSSDGFVTFDEGRRVKFVNRAFEQITGLPLDAVAGLSSDEFVKKLQARCEPTQLFPEMSRLREIARSVGRNDFGLVELAQPHRRVLRVSLKETSQDAVSQIIFLRDMTQLVEVEEMKSEFLAMAAHELRTPMTSIMGFVELLVTGEIPPEHSTEFHEIILGQCHRIAKILDELLDLARIEAGGSKEFNITNVNLKEVVKEVVDSFNVPQGRVAPDVDLPDLMCRADAGKARQVILNILSNAYKYSSEQCGPVNVTLVPLASHEIGKYVGIKIVDCGQGMAPKELERVFERFFRADKADGTPGTGLGMSIVKEIMDVLGGQVLIESAVGFGTAVTLLFPCDSGQG